MKGWVLLVQTLDGPRLEFQMKHIPTKLARTSPRSSQTPKPNKLLMKAARSLSSCRCCSHCSLNGVPGDTGHNIASIMNINTYYSNIMNTIMQIPWLAIKSWGQAKHTRRGHSIDILDLTCRNEFSWRLRSLIIFFPNGGHPQLKP